MIPSISSSSSSSSSSSWPWKNSKHFETTGKWVLPAEPPRDAVLRDFDAPRTPQNMSCGNGERKRSHQNFPADVISISMTNHEMIQDMEETLHKSCRWFPTTKCIIQSALLLNHNAIRRRSFSNPNYQTNERPTKRSKSERHTTNEWPTKRSLIEKFAFPINIALENNATFDVLDLLVNAGPDVLLEKDGRDMRNSLSIAISKGYGDDVVNMMLSSSGCGKIADRRGNYPLHTACSMGASLETIAMLAQAYPEALEQRNMNGETPLDVAQRRTVCPIEVVDYLQRINMTRIEERITGDDLHW